MILIYYQIFGKRHTDKYEVFRYINTICLSFAFIISFERLPNFFSEYYAFYEVLLWLLFFATPSFLLTFFSNYKNIMKKYEHLSLLLCGSYRHYIGVFGWFNFLNVYWCIRLAFVCIQINNKDATSQPDMDNNIILLICKNL